MTTETNKIPSLNPDDLKLIPEGEALEKYRKDIINNPDKLTQIRGFNVLGKSYNMALVEKEKILNELVSHFGGTSEELDILSLRVDEVTDEALQKMSDQEIQEFYNINGKQITLNFTNVTPLAKQPSIYRDYLRQVKVSYDATAMIDSQIVGLKNLMNEYDDEVKKNSQDLMQFNDYIFKVFKDKLDDPNITEDEKTVVKQFMAINSDGITLKPLEDYFVNDIKEHGTKSFKYAYTNNFEQVMNQAATAVSKFGMELYFNTYKQFEEYLPGDDTEKYKKTPDLFAFILFRYIKFRNRDEKLTQADVGFCAQVVNNMVLLKNKQMDESKTLIFSNSIKRILNLVLDK